MKYKITSVSEDYEIKRDYEGFKKYIDIVNKYGYNKEEQTIEINTIEELNQLLLDIEDIEYNKWIGDKMLLIDKESITIVDDHIDI